MNAALSLRFATALLLTASYLSTAFGESPLAARDDAESASEETSNSDRARSLIQQAKGDILAADDPEQEADRAVLQAHAREVIEEARTLFESALAEHEAEFRKFPLVIPEEDVARRRAREEAEQRYLRSRLYVAETVYYEAQTFNPGSERRKQVLERAADEFKAMHNAHRSQVVGLIARLRQGKCFEDMDMIREALGIYNELLDHPGTSETMRVLQARARRSRLGCLNHESRRDYRLVIVEGERWREQAGEMANTDVGLGILFEVCRAQAGLGTDRTVPEAQRTEYLESALDNARQVARNEGELRAPALVLIERILAALGRDTDRV